MLIVSRVVAQQSYSPLAERAIELVLRDRYLYLSDKLFEYKLLNAYVRFGS